MGKRKKKRKYSEKPYTSDQLVPVPIASPTPLANLSLNSVLLYSWWLCTVKSRGLAVGGFECRGRQGQRVLYSAAIAKRHDATTLETADGIMVAISGFINSSRTLENGFSPKVCSYLLFEFPFEWEEYASPSEGCSSNEESVCHGSCAISSLPPLDKLPVPAARMRNLLMFSAGDSRKLVFNHMLQKLSSHDFKTQLLLSIQTREVNIRKYVLILLLMVKIQIAKRRLRLSRMIIIRRVQGVKQKRNPRRRISRGLA